VKTFRTIHVVKQPVDRVYEAVRDRLPEIAAMLDDVESVRMLERKAGAGGGLSLVNEWRARLPLPRVLDDLVHKDSLGWIDRACWDDRGRRCAWEIEPLFLPGQIRCRGTTEYEAAMGGRGARVTFAGQIEITLGARGTIRGPLDQTVSSVVESIVTTVVPRNFRKTLDGACALIERPSRS
jgi:hypothetical protein